MQSFIYAVVAFGVAAYVLGLRGLWSEDETMADKKLTEEQWRRKLRNYVHLTIFLLGFITGFALGVLL